jgi:GGDEF domain-containing protein
MVDVDRFKDVNDDFGHEVGDQMLRLVAAQLRRVGGGGNAFRYGGEEFAVLFTGKSVEEVVPHLERLRKNVEETAFTLRGPARPIEKPQTPVPTPSAGKQVSVTVSIGVAQRADRRSAPSEALGLADAALYRAKKAGRNRVKT